MTSDFDRPGHAGKPPKSIGEIQQLLMSIHTAIDPPPQGPYIKGFHGVELVAVRSAPRRYKRDRVSAKPLQRDADFYRCLLLRRSAEAGAVSGGFLGANIGFGIPIILGSLAAIPLATFFGLVIGCVVGVAAAQTFVTRRRVDLFGSWPSLSDPRLVPRPG